MFKNLSKVVFFILSTIIGLIIVMIFDYFDKDFSCHDILVEFHGLVFDLIILGILLSLYESIRYKSDLIKRYKEEISDYKFLKTDEAKNRILRFVKKLVDLKVKQIDLSHCFLNNEIFIGYTEMKNWNFSAAKMINCYFSNSDMSKSKFYRTELNEASFEDVNLSDCRFDEAQLLFTKFTKCNFSGVSLVGAIVDCEEWFRFLKINENTNVQELEQLYQVNRYSLKESIVYKISRKVNTQK